MADISSFFDLSAMSMALGNPSYSSGSRSSFVLSSNYVHGTSGTAVGFRLVCKHNSPITDFYVFIGSRAGTPPTTMTCELRGFTTTSATIPQSVLNSGACVATASTPAAANKWVRFSFAAGAQYTPSVSEIVWVVVSFQSGSPDASNNAGVLIGNATSKQSNGFADCFSTSNGFSTGGTTTAGSIFSVAYGNGEVSGSPYTLQTSASSNTQPRGIRFDEGLPVIVTVVGARSGSSLPSNGTAELWLGDNGPAGTPDISVSQPSTSSLAAAFFSSPIEIPAHTPFRFVFRPASSTSSPNLSQIEDGNSFADLLTSSYMDGHAYWTESTDGSTWTDDPTKLPRLGLIVSDISGSVSGSGGVSRSRAFGGAM